MLHEKPANQAERKQQNPRPKNPIRQGVLAAHDQGRREHDPLKGPQHVEIGDRLYHNSLLFSKWLRFDPKIGRQCSFGRSPGGPTFGIGPSFHLSAKETAT
jgi:hypothetical protein